MALTTPSPAATASTRAIVAPGSRDRRRPSGALLWGLPSKIFTGAIAIIFLYPLVWTGVASVSPPRPPGGRRR